MPIRFVHSILLCFNLLVYKLNYFWSCIMTLFGRFIFENILFVQDTLRRVVYLLYINSGLDVIFSTFQWDSSFDTIALVLFRLLIIKNMCFLLVNLFYVSFYEHNIKMMLFFNGLDLIHLYVGSTTFYNTVFKYNIYCVWELPILVELGNKPYHGEITHFTEE